jgi:hypothetical protein
LGYFNTQLLHQFQHSHEYEAFHTQETEQDSCHRAVFHHEKNACEHKTHITNPEQDCELCDIIVQQDRFELTLLQDIQEPIIDRTDFALPNFMVLAFTPFNPSRAPPFSA